MKLNLRNGKAVITMNVQKLTRSKSGRSLLVATTRGVRRSKLKIDGKPVKFLAHVFVEAPIVTANPQAGMPRQNKQPKMQQVYVGIEKDPRPRMIEVLVEIRKEPQPRMITVPVVIEKDPGPRMIEVPVVIEHEHREPLEVLSKKIRPRKSHQP